MKATESTAKQVIGLAEHQPEITEQVNFGLIARFLKVVRLKVRRIFMKKDPDIYPFF